MSRFDDRRAQPVVCAEFFNEHIVSRRRLQAARGFGDGLGRIGASYGQRRAIALPGKSIEPPRHGCQAKFKRDLRGGAFAGGEIKTVETFGDASVHADPANHHMKLAMPIGSKMCWLERVIDHDDLMCRQTKDLEEALGHCCANIWFRALGSAECKDQVANRMLDAVGSRRVGPHLGNRGSKRSKIKNSDRFSGQIPPH